MHKFSIFKNRFRFLLLPGIVILCGIIFCFVNSGFNFDVEFSGGTRLHIAMEQEFNNEEVAQLIKDKTGVSAVVQKTGDGTEAIIKFKEVGDETIEANIFNALKEQYGLQGNEPLQIGTQSPSFGKNMQKVSFLAAFWAVILMLIYITIRFEWRSAIVAVGTLASNILVMISFYVIFKLPVNSSFIAAILTILGYSINDIIVVFDRIRENKGLKANKKLDIPVVVENSVWQSLTRSINTSVTTLITIVFLYILGVPSIQEFALPIIIGILIGTYSSIFIAAPIWAWWKNSSIQSKKKRARAAKA